MAGESRDTTAYERVGWLLRQWRMASADPTLRKLQPFAEVIAEHGHRADASRISRWESGRLRVPSSVLGTYEEVLGLPRASLVAVAEGMARSWNVRPPTRPAECAQGGPELEDAYAKVGAKTGVEGVDWFDWAGCVAAAGQVDDAHADGFATSVERLVSEASRASGLALVTRFEALRRLIEVPALQPAVMQAIGRHVIDPASQATLVPVVLIAEVRAEKAVSTLVSLLGQRSAQLQLGAVWGLYRKLTRREVTPACMAAIEAQVAQILFDGRNDAAVARVLPLLDVLPEPIADRLKRLRPALFTPRTRAPAGSATSRATMLANTVRAATARIEALTGRDVDPVGRAIIEDAYSAVSHDVRHQSAVALARSPYAAQLAEVVLEQTQPNRIAEGAAGVLPYLVGKAERDTLVARLDDPHCDLRQTLVTLAHVPGGPVPGVAPLIDCPEPLVSHAALYVAGMQRDAALRRIARDPRRDDAIRSGARWWIARGGRVDDLQAV